MDALFTSPYGARVISALRIVDVSFDTVRVVSVLHVMDHAVGYAAGTSIGVTIERLVARRG